MRNISNSIIDRVRKKFGVEAELVVGIKWTDDNEVYYSSHDFPGAVKSIVSVGRMDISQTIDNASSAQSLELVLSDTGGELTDILDTVDIHKRPARLYLSFSDVPLDQSLVLIDGELNSEILWDDSDRTLRLTILSKLEGRQFGFAVEDGLFEKVDDRKQTTPWPFRFGETCHRQALEIRNGIQGFLRIGQGVVDPTLDAQICQTRNIQCPKKIPTILADSDSPMTPTEAAADLRRRIRDADPNDPDAVIIASNSAAFGSTPYRINLGGTDATDIPDQSESESELCQHNKFKKLCQLLRDRANQRVFVDSTLTVAGGEDFPQGRDTRIRVGDVIYEGVFAGETFTIKKTLRQDLPENPDCLAPDDAALGYRQEKESQPGSIEECSQPSSTIKRQLVGGAGEALRRLSEFQSAGFKWLPAGTEVTSDEQSHVVYIVSAVPGTVTAVSAYRTFADTKVLTTVPTDLYEVVTTNYGDLEVVEIHMTRHLSDIREGGWGDDLYVSFDSDVGPNPVDVLEWIIERYTDFDIDAGSFNAVHSRLENYPCNFYHADKTDVLQVLNRVAREARSALIVSDNKLKITYLPAEPDSLKTLTSADLVSGSFSYRLTRTEDLVTSQRITWHPSGAESLEDVDPSRSATVENNIEKYGNFDASVEYHTINNKEQALKTATFWSIRESNTWKSVKFTTTLEHIDLELYDCVTLDIAPFPTTKVIITSSSYNPETSLMEFEAWTPILSGTKEPYFFAWPADQPSGIMYPDDNRDLPVPAVSVTPPEDHPLYVKPADVPAQPTIGDRFPSDLDDTFPVTSCFEPTGHEVVDEIEPQFKRIEFKDFEEIAAEVDEEQLRGGGASEKDDENTECGLSIADKGCVYRVTVRTATATGVTARDVADACNATHGARCAGSLNEPQCHIFGSASMAQAFSDSIKAHIAENQYNWFPGKSDYATATDPQKITQGDAQCEDLGDIELSGAGGESV